MWGGAASGCVRRHAHSVRVCARGGVLWPFARAQDPDNTEWVLTLCACVLGWGRCGLLRVRRTQMTPSGTPPTQRPRVATPARTPSTAPHPPAAGTPAAGGCSAACFHTDSHPCECACARATQRITLATAHTLTLTLATTPVHTLVCRHSSSGRRRQARPTILDPNTFSIPAMVAAATSRMSGQSAEPAPAPRPPRCVSGRSELQGWG